MMNKQKTSKAWRWKVATFLPLLALLLMAFGNRSEKVPAKEKVPEKVVETTQAVLETQSSQSGRLIEIRKDGNYIDNKLCTLDEIVNKGKEWGKASNDWIHLRIDESIPYNRIDEISENLRNAKVYHITQSIGSSDDIIYPAGDVGDLAKFTQGSWSKWMDAQLDHFSGGKSKQLEYKMSYSFIIDKSGKVRDARIVNRSDYPELNDAMEKVLAQIPDWIPAKRFNKPVSVLAHYVGSMTIVKSAVEMK